MRPALAGLQVDRMTHEDVVHVVALYKRVSDAFGPGLPADFLKAWQPTPLEFTSQMEGVRYFIARREGRVVGAVGCEVRHGTVHLVHLGVDPEHRRQKVASSLLGAAVEWAKSANVPVLWTEALSRFPAAAALLKHVGFSEAGLLHRHEWGEDVRLFERVL